MTAAEVYAECADICAQAAAVHRANMDMGGPGYGIEERMAATAEAIRAVILERAAAMPPPAVTAERDAARAVRVKPLEWDKHPDADYDPSCNEHYGGGQKNLAGQNEYAIYPHPCALGLFVLDVMGNRCELDFPSVGVAKAAAQADYEARTLAALEKPE